MFRQTVESSLSKAVTERKDKTWLLKTGVSPLQVHLDVQCIWVQGARNLWLLKTGDPLIEETT